MKAAVIAVIIALSLIVATTVMAVPTGKTLEFEGGGAGKVVFDGKKHADAGKKCNDCHKPDLFPQMKKGTVKITMNDINSGKQCGTCHDGKGAFEAKSNCAKCHQK